jgi:hypothetical protein
MALAIGLAIIAGICVIILILLEIYKEICKHREVQEKTQRETIGMSLKIMEIEAILKMVFEKEIKAWDKEHGFKG